MRTTHQGTYPLLLCTVLGAMLSFLPPLAHGELLPPPFPYHEGPVSIANENSGKCLNIRGGSLENHARAEQQDCTKSNHWWLVPTDWNSYRIIASHSGADLDLNKDTNAIQQFGPNVGGNEPWKNQRWEFHYVSSHVTMLGLVPIYEIRSRDSGQCVDVAWFSTANGADVNQFPCKGSSNQLWTLGAHIGNGSVLLARHSNKCLDIAQDPQDRSRHLQQYECHGGANQRWSFSFGSTVGRTTYYMIRSSGSGRCLDVAGGSLDDHAGVNEYECHGDDNQLWQISPLRDDYFAIINKRSGKCLDIEGVSLDDKARAQQYTCGGFAAANQSFRVSAFAQRRIELIWVAEDNGSDRATIDAPNMKLLVDRVNATYAPVGLRLVYDVRYDKADVNSTAIYNLGDAQHKYYCKPTGKDLLPELCANAVAGRYPGKLVIFVRKGNGGNGFSTERMKFIVMGPYAGKSCPADDTWLAHELGHHLGLVHSFVGVEDQAGAERLLREASNDITVAFEADGLSDTPPMPSWQAIEKTNCSSSVPYFWQSLQGIGRTIRFAIWVDDPMSYYYYVPKRITPEQGAVIRALMNVRGWNRPSLR